MDPTLLGQSATRSFEAQAKSLIAASEANIARIESQIRDLIRLRDRERGVIARLRQAIAPVHKLPAELLVEIFRSVPSEEITQILALSQVCAYWRQVAHTTPQLWTQTLHATVDKTPPESYVAGAKIWLERSAPLPISVYLHARKGADPGALIDVLATVAHRWKRATFSLDSLSLLSCILPNPLGALEYLTLICVGDKKSHANVVTFLNATRLCSLNLTTRQTTLPPMPWSQLTKINVDNPSPRACLDALIQCTNIVSARFDTFPWPTLPDLSDMEITTLARLESLHLNFSIFSEVGSHFMPFITRLALPALKDLRLDLNHDCVWTSADFTQFQLRSPNIEYLNIESLDIASSDLLTALRHAPSLTKLRVEDCYGSFDDDVAAGLEYSETNIVDLAPGLVDLSLSGVGDYFENDMLYAMIESRWWTDEQALAFPTPPRVARWASIDICRGEDCHVSPELEAKLDGYRSQGLDVYVC
ncbi:hypothetical protein FB451DRAFT_429401 [Mycena latifolia]|nr:hypothetical protein FB451DRAFT_429401 [Mycena latifolia]